MDGIRLRDEIVASLRATIEAAGSPPVCLATVLVGDDKPSQIYVAQQAARRPARPACTSRHVELPADVSQAQVEDTVAALAADPTVHGILCQLPLPDGLDPEPVLAPDPARRRTSTGSPSVRWAGSCAACPATSGCTPLGVMRLLERYGVSTAGKRAVVIGRITLIGLPQVLLLGRKGVDATVTLAHSRTRAT